MPIIAIAKVCEAAYDSPADRDNIYLGLNSRSRVNFMTSSFLPNPVSVML
jgi:hypothetical protein